MEKNGSPESPPKSQEWYTTPKCGWLRKQGGFSKTWHMCWFVLKGDQLYYFKDKDETKLLGTISLIGNKVIEHPYSEESPGQFLFEVLPGKDQHQMTANYETYLLMANTQNDMEEWLKTIRRVIWAPFGGGIFGQKLEETIRFEKRYGNFLAPMLVEQCVDFIRQWGLKEEGLFRLSGQANLVKELRDAFDYGEKPSFDSNTDVHTVASLLQLYLQELPEPIIPFAKYEDFLSCASLLIKEEEMGVKELVKQVKNLPVINYNLLKYICSFLNEVQTYSSVNKTSMQNLVTVFGSSILRPKVEDPRTIMEGTVAVQHLLSVITAKHKQLFPKDSLQAKHPKVLGDNNNKIHRKSVIDQRQNQTKDTASIRRSWEKLECPRRVSPDNGSLLTPPGTKANSPSNSAPRYDISRSPALTVKKNPAFNKGSGIVTNGSFSSSTAESNEKAQYASNGCLQARRTSSLKGAGTKMGTCSVQNGGVRGGLLSSDALANTVRSPGTSWPCGGPVTLRDSKQKDPVGDLDQPNRLSTYDNVQQQFSTVNSEDTWSVSLGEISFSDNSTSGPDPDFGGANCEDPVLERSSLDEPSYSGNYENQTEKRSVGDHRSHASSSGDLSETSNPNALHSLVSCLKEEINKQKIEYESRIKSLEQRNLTLEMEMMTLHEELDQERKKFTMAEIKMRNAERAKEDAEKRNDILQKEMEQFFSTFGELTVEPHRTERDNTIWIQ
ncbi:rho GTPase-activating protein 24 isoform X2 [Sarcophilus harrisii]|uniref:rho GTPase-activating protein 24 isoform X2 n=1 Tax=Sarcophilus harrisii TaxID=9305 RepID=UPI000273C5D0|nr:rho GTPase-activating protein 24 isoform X2 [Sarcophilus harrisii]